MCSLFCHLAILENDDIVGIPNSSQTVRDDKNCPLFAKSIKRFLHRILSNGIKGRSCLVWKQKSHALESIAQAVHSWCDSSA